MSDLACTKMVNRIDNWDRDEKLFALWYLMGEFKGLIQSDIEEMDGENKNEWDGMKAVSYMEAQKLLRFADEAEQFLVYEIF